jgi:hypothetical protein
MYCISDFYCVYLVPAFWDTTWCEWLVTFSTNLLPPSSGNKWRQLVSTETLVLYGFINQNTFTPEGYILTGIRRAQEKSYIMKFVGRLSLTCLVWLGLVLKSSIFWDITPCSPLKENGRFGGIHRLHLQGRRMNQARTHREAGSKHSLRYTQKTEPLITTAVRTSNPTWFGFGCTGWLDNYTILTILFFSFLEVPQDVRYECG